MRSVGLSVETFGSGPEFLKSIDTRLPDCVVLDLRMPQMNQQEVPTANNFKMETSIPNRTISPSDRNSGRPNQQTSWIATGMAAPGIKK